MSHSLREWQNVWYFKVAKLLAKDHNASRWVMLEMYQLTQRLECFQRTLISGPTSLCSVCAAHTGYTHSPATRVHGGLQCGLGLEIHMQGRTLTWATKTTGAAPMGVGWRCLDLGTITQRNSSACAIQRTEVLCVLEVTFQHTRYIPS